MDEALATLVRLGTEVLPVSAVGWLGLRLLGSSLGRTEKTVRLGGPIAFVVIWGLAVFVRFKMDGGTSSILSILYVSLFALGLFSLVVRLVVGAFARPSKRR
jgi:hypothetical protein